MCKAERHKDKLERRLVYVKVQYSLDVSCSFLVHLPKLQVFVVNNKLEVKNFMRF